MSQLNKALWTNMMRLKLLNKDSAPVRFALDKSPFDDEDNESTTERDFYVIIGRIFPNSEIFKQHAIQIEMRLTPNYPMEPPEVRFLTPVHHPNVDKNGKFCHALLSKTARWRPGTTLVEIVKAVTEHIDNPDADYAVTLEIGKEYMENRMEFNRKAVETAKKYGLPRN